MNTDLKHIQAIWRLGLIGNEALPEVAAVLLDEGKETENIIRLAVCDKTDTPQIERFFIGILNDFNIPKLSQLQSLKEYANSIAISIIEEKLSPYAGAKMIWEADLKWGEKGDHELDPFIYAASEMEDRPEDKEFFNRAIIEEAKSYLRKT